MGEFSTARINAFRGNLYDLRASYDRNDLKTDTYVLSGLISKFCIGVELGWKCMKDIISGYHGVSDYATGSPRETLEKAFQLRMIEDDGVWYKMLKLRGTLAHDYNSQLAYSVVEDILNTYIPCFEKTNEMFQRYIDKTK